MRRNYQSVRTSSSSVLPSSEIDFKIAPRYRHNLQTTPNNDEASLLTISNRGDYNYNFTIDHKIHTELNLIKQKNDDAKTESSKMESAKMDPSKIAPSSLILQPSKLSQILQPKKSNDLPLSMTKSQNEEVINLVQPTNLNSDPFNDAYLGTIADQQALNELFGFSDNNAEIARMKNSSSFVLEETPVSPADSQNLTEKSPEISPEKSNKSVEHRQIENRTNNLANLIQLDSFHSKPVQHNSISINTKIKNVVDGLPNFSSTDIFPENLQYSSTIKTNPDSKNSSSASSFVEVEPEHDHILDRLEGEEQEIHSTQKIQIKVPKQEISAPENDKNTWASYLTPHQQNIALQLAEAGYCKNVITSAFLVDSSIKRRKDDKEAEVMKEKNKSLVNKIFRKNSSRKNSRESSRNLETSLEYGIVDYVECLTELQQFSNLDNAVTTFIAYNGYLKPAALHCQIASMGFRIKPESVISALKECKDDKDQALNYRVVLLKCHEN